MTRIWQDVADPRNESCPTGDCCEVWLECHRWSHFRDHHDDLDEPWDDWLTPSVVADLRSSWGSGFSEEARKGVRDTVSERMMQSAKECLRIPLAVLYDVAQPLTVERRHSRWVLTADLVLSCGAKLCIREREKRRYAVCTCFFIAAICSAPPRRRWRWLMSHLIRRYAKDNGNDTFSPPDSSWGLQVHDETGETIVSPRFRNNARWVLDRPLAEPWFSIPDPWPQPPIRPLGRPARY